MDTQSKILISAGVTAATAVVGLVIAQTDRFSRKFLGPPRLQAKRLLEYAYRWEQSVDKALLRCQIYLAGGVNAHEEQTMQTSTTNRNRNQELLFSPTKLWDGDGIKNLIKEWMQQEKKQEKENRKTASNRSSSPIVDAAMSPFPRILGLSREEESREILVELYHTKSGMFQLPLLRFGLILADIMEEDLTTTALCFVADASSGLGSHLVADMLDASKAGVVRQHHHKCFALFFFHAISIKAILSSLLFQSKFSMYSR